MQITSKQAHSPTYYIMGDQPDCCGTCGCRLDLLEIKMVEDERVFVSECLGCHRKVFIVEDKPDAVNDI